MPNEGFFGLGNLSTWQHLAYEQGYSASEALREFQDVGGGWINADIWYQNWGQVVNYAEEAQGGYGFALDAVPEGPDVASVAWGQGGKFGMTLQLQVRSGTTGEIESTTYTYLSDTPFPATEALDQAISNYDIAEEITKYGNELVGALPVVAFTTRRYGT